MIDYRTEQGQRSAQFKGAGAYIDDEEVREATETSRLREPDRDSEETTGFNAGLTCKGPCR